MPMECFYRSFAKTFVTERRGAARHGGFECHRGDWSTQRTTILARPISGLRWNHATRASSVRRRGSLRATVADAPRRADPLRLGCFARGAPASNLLELQVFRESLVVTLLPTRAGGCPVSSGLAPVFYPGVRSYTIQFFFPRGFFLQRGQIWWFGCLSSVCNLFSSIEDA